MATLVLLVEGLPEEAAPFVLASSLFGVDMVLGFGDLVMGVEYGLAMDDGML